MWGWCDSIRRCVKAPTIKLADHGPSVGRPQWLASKQSCCQNKTLPFILTQINYCQIFIKTQVLFLLQRDNTRTPPPHVFAVEFFPANKSELAVTPVCTSRGEDASADMLYGDINLAGHRANGESSWIKRRTRLSQRVCPLCFSRLSHKAPAVLRGKPTRRWTASLTRCQIHLNVPAEGETPRHKHLFRHRRSKKAKIPAVKLVLR